MNRFISLFIWLSLAFSLEAQVTILVTSVPTNTPASTNIYISGDFNNWDPAGNQLQALSGNQFLLTLNNPPTTMEFKITRGDWNSVEGDTRGCEIGNRTASPSPGDTLRLVVASWKDLTPCNSGGNSTANAQMSIMDPAFNMPQLGRQRKIWIYLPPDYQSSGRRYPVMYMQDGQNLFDRATAFAGEWAVDETLTNLFNNGDPGIIIIGIDNGGSERLNEYSPWFQAGLGGGQGNQYLDFMINTLKPYVDQNFRTRPDPANTGIMGSSMGGLISLYAGLMRPDIYGRVGVFSPSVWFAPQIWDSLAQATFDPNQRYYILAGGREGSNLPADAQRLERELLAKGHTSSTVHRELDPNGSHTEAFWAASFGEAYQWLFRPSATGLNQLPSEQFRAFPNPLIDTLRIEYPGQYTFQLFSPEGKLLLNQKADNDHLVSFAEMPSGPYLLKILKDGKSLSKVVWKK